MPKRYFDAVEAEARIKDLFPDMPKIDFMDNIRNWREKNKQYLQCLDVIRSLSTANVVGVVRCKDCKHMPTGTGANHDLEFPDDKCPCQCAGDYWYSWMPPDDWFCPCGERKGEEDATDLR